MPATWTTEQELQLAMTMLWHHTNNFKNLDWKNVDPHILEVFGKTPSAHACHARTNKRTLAKDDDDDEAKAEDDGNRAPKRARRASAKGKEMSYAEFVEDDNDSA
ncbi:uncharacterized protein PG986_005670 [Apiospora aurea]|uniref:Myb-like domain-containing protein n=1 Tax=Apiospora aurea TaxID=335848 RepID=A0ABR1QI90_9PEZI